MLWWFIIAGACVGWGIHFNGINCRNGPTSEHKAQITRKWANGECWANLHKSFPVIIILLDTIIVLEIISRVMISNDTSVNRVLKLVFKNTLITKWMN